MNKRIYSSPLVKVVDINVTENFLGTSGENNKVTGMDALPSEPGKGFGW